MSFSFRKVYADAVADDGTAFIAYHVRVDAFSVRTAYASLEIYHPDGRREVLHPQKASAPAGIDAETGRVELRLELPAGHLVLGYEPVHQPWTPSSGVPRRELQWSVRVPRAAVTGCWSGAPGRRDFKGSGYIDRVELSRITRSLRLRTLEWGRVHLPDSTIVFTGIGGSSGEWWRRVAVWPSLSAASPEELQDFRLRPRDGLLQLELTSELQPHPAILLDSRRTLHEGSAFDSERASAFAQRLAFRLATGPTREERWLSRAWTERDSGEIGSAIHEVVRFGR